MSTELYQSQLWIPCSQQTRDDHHEQPSGGQKVPDGILSAMNKPGAKPFSYGIDLAELKEKTQKRAPAVAPKKKKQMDTPPTNENVAPNRQQFVATGPVAASYNKPVAKHIIESETYRMIHANESAKQPVVEHEPVSYQQGSKPNKQSMSFRVLQWMTDTEKEEAEREQQEEKPRRQRNRLLRHNSEDDEMRFSGLHPKSHIPSGSFQKLKRYTGSDSDTSTGQRTEENQECNEEKSDGVGHYDETSIRYMGKHIPSPSFRVLQSWAELDTAVDQPSTKKKDEDSEDDGLPDTLSSDEVVDVRYKGGHIPSKIFKSLQKAVGDDTPENPEDNPPTVVNSQNGVEHVAKPTSKPSATTSENMTTDF